MSCTISIPSAGAKNCTSSLAHAGRNGTNVHGVGSNRDKDEELRVCHESSSNLERLYPGRIEVVAR